jgi:hypothetical protein
MVNFRICQYKIAAIAVNLAIFESRLADAWPTLGRRLADAWSTNLSTNLPAKN